MPLTQAELIEIKERAEKASGGKWLWEGDKFGDIVIFSPKLRGFHNNGGTIAKLDGCSADDAEFIAHAREDIPRLVAEIEWLREGLTYLTEAHHFDSPGQMAEVAEYYLNGGDNE